MLFLQYISTNHFLSSHYWHAVKNDFGVLPLVFCSIVRDKFWFIFFSSLMILLVLLQGFISENESLAVYMAFRAMNVMENDWDSTVSSAGVITGITYEQLIKDSHDIRELMYSRVYTIAYHALFDALLTQLHDLSAVVPSYLLGGLFKRWNSSLQRLMLPGPHCRSFPINWAWPDGPWGKLFRVTLPIINIFLHDSLARVGMCSLVLHVCL